MLDGVEWVNDSKATNVDSVLVALRAFPGNLLLIAGGKGKGAPYQPMVEASRGKVKGVLTIGEDAETIAAAYQGQAPVHAVRHAGAGRERGRASWRRPETWCCCLPRARRTISSRTSRTGATRSSGSSRRSESRRP